MSAVGIVLVILCVALATTFIVFRILKGGFLALGLKALASFGLVVSGMVALIVSDATTQAKWVIGLITIGLLFGMIGDIVLDLKVMYPDKDKIYLNSGMLSFAIGHVFYIVALSILVDVYIIDYNSTIAVFGCIVPILISMGVAILLTIGITLSSKSMGLDFGAFKWQTVGYTFMLSLSTVYSLVLAIMGGGYWLAFIALLLFFASDIVLSFQYFGGKIANKTLIGVNHGLYYAAQILLVALVFVI